MMFIRVANAILSWGLLELTAITDVWSVYLL